MCIANFYILCFTKFITINYVQYFDRILIELFSRIHIKNIIHIYVCIYPFLKFYVIEEYLFLCFFEYSAGIFNS